MSVKGLKSRLSACIRMVRKAKEVRVTHRGETVAGTRSLTRLADHDIDSELRRCAQAGKVRLGARNRPEVYPNTSVQLPDELVRALLSESRGEH